MAPSLSAVLGPGCSGFARRDRLQPAVGVGGFAADYLEEGLLDSLGHRPTPTPADRDTVDGFDRGHLDGGPDEKDLVGHVEHFPWERLLADLEAQLACNRDHRVAGDPIE